MVFLKGSIIGNFVVLRKASLVTIQMTPDLNMFSFLLRLVDIMMLQNYTVMYLFNNKKA